MIYHGANADVLSRIPESAARILDLGCGTGEMGRRIKLERACQIIGVTNSVEEVDVASGFLDAAVQRDLTTYDPFELGQFDCILCSHLLEHLAEPGPLLQRLHRCLRPGGVLIVALPNILHLVPRLQFLRGRFRYSDSGPIDRTHLRFYDYETSRELLIAHGFSVQQQTADARFPLSVVRRLLPKFAVRADRFAERYLPGLLGLQFILVCESKR